LLAQQSNLLRTAPLQPKVSPERPSLSREDKL
jgi:hypothetical protein